MLGSAITADSEVSARGWQWRAQHPVFAMVASRVFFGVITLFLVATLVFFATEVLPGNAAYAILKNTASPDRLHALEARLHLNEPVLAQYWHWLTDTLRGNFGNSLVSNLPVTGVVWPRVANSAVLVLLAGVISSVLGVFLGVLAAARRDSRFDHALSVGALVATALPEFVVAVILVSVFATLLFHILPATTSIAPGTSALSDPVGLILPVATLVIVTMPYTFRMTRGAMVDALESDYVEMAELKGVSSRRVLFVHSLFNAAAPTAQVIGLNLLYLAGGIVVVEYVFNFPGLGQGLVAAISDRDIPVIQYFILVLAAFYVLVNIVADVVALLATPRRRLPRGG